MWYYNGQEFKEEDVKDWYGMVYLISDKLTGKKYIGQKVFFFRRTIPPLKSSGSKRKRKIVKISDYVSYYGSNTTLQELVAANDDPNRFHREILHLCRSASEMNYLETKTIFETDALLSDEYFNEYVQCRINSKHLKNLQK